MQCPYLWWHCSSRMGPAGTALCWQPCGLLGSIPENFTLSTLAKLLRKMFSLAKNTVMQDSILTTKSQANILHRKIYVLYSVLSGWKSWPFFCKKQLGFFAGQSSSGGFICFYSEHLNKDSYVGFKRKFWPCYLWQVCICGGTGPCSLLLCKAELQQIDLEQLPKSLQPASVYLGELCWMGSGEVLT